MSGYLLPFEIVSVHLLVVLIGAAYLARSKKRAAGRRPDLSRIARRGNFVMNLLSQPIGVSHYLAVGAVLFVSGVVCMATKRNAWAC